MSGGGIPPAFIALFILVFLFVKDSGTPLHLHSSKWYSIYHNFMQCMIIKVYYFIDLKIKPLNQKEKSKEFLRSLRRRETKMTCLLSPEAVSDCETTSQIFLKWLASYVIKLDT